MQHQLHHLSPVSLLRKTISLPNGSYASLWDVVHSIILYSTDRSGAALPSLQQSLSSAYVLLVADRAEWRHLRLATAWCSRMAEGSTLVTNTWS